jgi:hypothetical protein
MALSASLQLVAEAGDATKADDVIDKTIHVAMICFFM